MSKPRTTEPVRNQGRISFELPHDAIPPEHPISRGVGSESELSNANVRRMGVTQLLGRGIAKATSVALIAAITHEVLARAATLLA